MSASDYISSISASAISGLVLCLQGVPLDFVGAVSILNPVIETTINGIVSNIIKSKKLTKNECLRLGISYKSTIDIINSKLNNSVELRDDCFFKGKEISDASQILESTIKNILDDAEIIKTMCYARFISNIPFKNECSTNALVALNSLIRQLSYRELCIIRWLHDVECYDSSDIENYNRCHYSVDVSVFFNQLCHLKSVGIIISYPPYRLSAFIGNLKLSQIGIQIYKMLELELIVEDDLVDIKAMMNTCKTK